VIVVDVPLCGQARADLPAPAGLRDCLACASWLEQVQSWAEEVGAGAPKERIADVDVWAHHDAVKVTNPDWPEEPLVELTKAEALELAGALQRAAARLDDPQ
jgi:hypothetical protein